MLYLELIFLAAARVGVESVQSVQLPTDSKASRIRAAHVDANDTSAVVLDASGGIHVIGDPSGHFGSARVSGKGNGQSLIRSAKSQRGEVKRIRPMMSFIDSAKSQQGEVLRVRPMMDVGQQITSNSTSQSRWPIFKKIGEAVKNASKKVKEAILPVTKTNAFAAIKEKAKKAVVAAGQAAAKHGAALASGMLAFVRGDPAPLLAAAKACFNDVVEEVREGKEEIHEETANADKNIQEVATEEMIEQIQNLNDVAAEERTKLLSAAVSRSRRHESNASLLANPDQQVSLSTALAALHELQGAAVIGQVTSLSAVASVAQEEIRQAEEISDIVMDGLKDTTEKEVEALDNAKEDIPARSKSDSGYGDADIRVKRHSK